jgi:hypothetical protein
MNSIATILLPIASAVGIAIVVLIARFIFKKFNMIKED